LTPDGDPKSEAMLTHHFNREHNIAKRLKSTLHRGRLDNGGYADKLEDKCIEQLAAQKLGLKKRGTGGSSQRKTRKCVLGENHSKMRVQV
jgi:hypothetical protein